MLARKRKGEREGGRRARALIILTGGAAASDGAGELGNLPLLLRGPPPPLRIMGAANRAGR